MGDSWRRSRNECLINHAHAWHTSCKPLAKPGADTTDDQEVTMSHILNAATKVHDTQLKAAETLVSTLTTVATKAAGTVGQVGQNVPELPSFLAGPVGQVNETVRSVVGTRTDVFDYLDKSGDDWDGVRKNLRSGLADAFTG